jgi:hypothetical protein
VEAQLHALILAVSDQLYTLVKIMWYHLIGSRTSLNIMAEKKVLAIAGKWTS